MMNDMELTSSQIDDLIQDLQGTTKSLDTATEELFGVSAFDLHIEVLSEIDNHIFQCDGCGWWCDLGEQSHEVEDDMVCEDCESDYTG
jgi:hypothetical protein